MDIAQAQELAPLNSATARSFPKLFGRFPTQVGHQEPCLRTPSADASPVWPSSHSQLSLPLVSLYPLDKNLPPFERANSESWAILVLAPG